jgi:hypothetical protein
MGQPFGVRGNKTLTLESRGRYLPDAAARFLKVNLATSRKSPCN